MTEVTAESGRIAVWAAMAEHFLDTERRHEIPLTALCCVEAGFSVEQAKLIWQDELTPVVGPNLFDVAGEWACWDRDWLVESIARLRAGSPLPGPCRFLRYWLSGGINHRVWLSIARCMQQLLLVTDAAQRRQLAQDLGVLSRHYFDFCPKDLLKLGAQQRARLAELYAGPFLSLLRPSLIPGEGASAAARVQKALTEAEPPPDVDLADLRRRFESAVRAVGARLDAGGVFEGLVLRYAQSFRHYHTLRHVDACLAWLDWCHGLAQRPAEVALALWFHDAVYELGASDNERRSAQLACEQLGALGVPRETCARIAEYVIATERHESEPAGDAALVCDIDLAVLGARDQEFARFEGQIRDEYGFVDEALFRVARGQVLQRFLDRSEIFGTVAMREALERRARANLSRRIIELRFGA